jgi:uncharacterized membrane protein YraQ (UPF0718 family)
MFNLTFLFILALALAATGLAYYVGPAVARDGATTAVSLFVSVLPNLLAGFLLGGMVQVLLPPDVVAHYIGEESGFRGLVLATLAGILTPGGPYVQFPLVASLWKAGTGVGPLTAYLTAWSLLGFQRILVWEAPILGWRFVIMRTVSALSAPILVGWLAGAIHRRFPLF